MPEGEPATEASIAGRYRLKAADYEEDYDQSLQEDYYLVLNEDGTAQFEAVPIADPADVSVVARGTWVRDGAGVLIEVDEFAGETLAQPETIRYEYRDGFPVATDYQADDRLYSLAEAEFTIGAGERHPLVRELHQRLAAIDCLGFTDPGDDLFTEATRKAVVAFQESQGLLPNGEVNPVTWVLLGNLPSRTPACNSSNACCEVASLLPNAVRSRSGRSMAAKLDITVLSSSEITNAPHQPRQQTKREPPPPPRGLQPDRRALPLGESPAR